ncbi:hypothetical protein SAMN04487972_12026 [Paracoccus halophilus]|uniref:Uncharacterized protein n=1 Tax=Paracoccus halophilus TaxID=376733 RepID=A0A099EZE3_9RHOB|nr:hypothetical protein [Paracoccus halophilus]KGJ03292.1 hypothetical protein IT41_14680 [Paracoccus halophilus]SFA58347.1 hypothetical protein SAMN04487972_12026 [Paracoccus halophilus]
MKKRMILGGTAVLAVLAAVAVAQMRPGEEPTPEGLVTEADDNPFAGLDEIFNEPGPDLGMTEEEVQAEDDYLRMSPPAGETGDVPEALTENVLYETCEKVPEVKSAEYQAKSEDGYASRMIYSYVLMRHALDSRDCTCAGKVAPFAEVQKIKDQIAAEHGDDWNRYQFGDDYFEQSRKLRDQVEAMCGGKF